MVICGSRLINSKSLGLSSSIDVGPQEDKFPAKLLLLPFNHSMDLIVSVVAAGIFHAIGGDDEQGLIRHILAPSIFMDVADVMNRTADCIQESRTAPDIVFFVCHGRDVLQRQSIVDDLAFIVKQHSGDHSIAGFFSLLFNQRIKTADSVLLQPSHRAAPVKDKN